MSATPVSTAFSASSWILSLALLSTLVSSGCEDSVDNCVAAATETVASWSRLGVSVLTATAAFLSWLQCPWPETESSSLEASSLGFGLTTSSALAGSGTLSSSP